MPGELQERRHGVNRGPLPENWEGTDAEQRRGGQSFRTKNPLGTRWEPVRRINREHPRPSHGYRPRNGEIVRNQNPIHFGKLDGLNELREKTPGAWLPNNAHAT